MIGCSVLMFMVAPFVAGLILVFVASSAHYTRERCSCGYPLTSLPATSRQCPECGLPRRHIAIRSRGLLKVGVVLMLSPLAWLLFGLVVLMGVLG